MVFARLLPGAAFAAAVALASPAAFAHIGNHADGFTHGFTHPFGGLDHLLAMVAIGLWALQQGGRARYALPLTFMASMALGFSLGLGGIDLPYTETGIALSVLALGLAIALSLKPGLGLALPVTALFALCHGYAHGAEMPEGAPALLYAAGMLLGTGLLHGAGLLAARYARLPLLRAAGAATAAAGLALLVI
ncbi:HupE/UreJ family protein [Ferrovibrio sp. MS7]|uniref:HupE/UreJ family protein n=1 Tax=Ferrovibrio plantarum TaxID=3119164 RepID=UPI0031358012